MYFIVEFLNFVINLYIVLIIANVIFSWLYAFNIVNMSNHYVVMVARLLHKLTEPLLRPIRRILPDMGGLDISPVILMLIIYLIKMLINSYIVFEFINTIIILYIIIIFTSIITSLLIKFNIISDTNQFASLVRTILSKLTDPILHLIRKRVPKFGDWDSSPVILLFCLILIKSLIFADFFPNFSFSNSTTFIENSERNFTNSRRATTQNTRYRNNSQNRRYSRDQNWEARIKLRDGGIQTVTILASTWINAKNMLEAKYGVGSVIIGPRPISSSYSRDQNWEARIKLRNGGIQTVTIRASTWINAKNMLEANYGVGSVIIGPRPIR